MREPGFADQTTAAILAEARKGEVWRWPKSLGVWGLPLLFSLTLVLYGLGSLSTLLLVDVTGLRGALFIPAGITVAFLLRLERRYWWVVLVAAGLTEFIIDVFGGYSTTRSTGFALANMAGPLLGATIVSVTCGAIDLARRRHVLWYTLGAVLAGPALTAAIGAGVVRIWGGGDFAMTFTHWWLGDGLSVVLVGTAILAKGSSVDRRSLPSFWGAALIAASIAVTVAVLTLTDLPLVFASLIVVVLAGALFGVRAVAATSIAVAITIAGVMGYHPGGLIIGLSEKAALSLIELQVGIFSLAGLLIAAEAHERELAVHQAATSTLAAQTMERERRQHHELAIQVQRGLLPDRLVSPPGIDVAARHEAASGPLEVGGDWYDTIDLTNGRFGVVVGDIVGHGIEAMTAMGRVRTALGALARSNEDPASLLSAVDDFVGTADGTEYATVFYAIVDPEGLGIKYASAGHPPGLLISQDGSTVWLDRGQSQPLSGRPGDPRRFAEVPLEAGTILVLYSDGLVERRGESLTTGLERLAGVTSELVEMRASDICNAVVERLGVDTTREDDIVVLVMKAELDGAYRFHRSYRARPEEVHNIRSHARTWMAELGVDPPVMEDLLIALSEAASNAVRHAYRDITPGMVDVRIKLQDDTLEVEVADHGRWRPPHLNSSSRGLGTGIISALSDSFRIDTSNESTRVHFSLTAPESAEP